MRLEENRQVWDQEKEVNKRKEKNIKSNPTLTLSNTEVKNSNSNNQEKYF